jgi:hypothetical protein
MAREYTVSFDNVTVSAAQDLFNLQAAANKPIRIVAVKLNNVGGTADAGDAQEELLRISYKRLASAVTNGSGGTAPTPAKLDSNDAAAGLTARVNDVTTRATSSGATTVIDPDGFNVRIPYLWVPTPEARIEAVNGEALIIGLETAPADAISLSGTVYVEEE